LREKGITILIGWYSKHANSQIGWSSIQGFIHDALHLNSVISSWCIFRKSAWGDTYVIVKHLICLNCLEIKHLLKKWSQSCQKEFFLPLSCWNEFLVILPSQENGYLICTRIKKIQATVIVQIWRVFFRQDKKIKYKKSENFQVFFFNIEVGRQSDSFHEKFIFEKNSF